MGEEVLPAHLRSKLSSILAEAEADSGRPLHVIPRLRSLQTQIESMCGDSWPPMMIPVDLLYELIELVSECRVFSYERRTAAVSKNLFFPKQLLLRHPLSDFMFNRRMRRRMDSVKRKIEKCNPIPRQLLPSPPQTVMKLESEGPWRIVGFEAEAKTIEAWLMPSKEEEDAAALKLRAVGIVGRIGCGKSALAQKVFDSPSVKKEFSPRIWVSQSNKLIGREKRVVFGNYILAEIERDDHVPESDYTSLAEKLRQGLMGKRYLLVIDGAWRLDDWFDGFLPRGSGGAVVVTSRKENPILRMAGDDERVNVMRLESHLSDKICWQIFSQVVQQQGKWEITHPKLCSIQDDVTRYFNGLPVVAKTLGNILPDFLKSYWIPARDLSIAWGDNPGYWKWISLSPPQQTEEVAELRTVCWLDIKGYVELKKLLVNATYSAYLVFKLKEDPYGLDKATARVRIVCDGKDPEGEEECRVFIDPDENIPGQEGRFPQVREGDGEGEEWWMEIKLGDFFTTLGDGGRSVEVSLFETQDLCWKSGLVVKGIELR